jgi:hypothetical protein
VVAEDSTLVPQPLTRASSAAEGRPKWKLTTGGRKGSIRSAMASLKGARPPPSGMLAGSMPNSAWKGASAARHRASRAASGTGGVWQKKLRFQGRVVCAVRACSSLRSTSGVSMAQGSEPSPPAFDTATAMALPCTPAIGAWTIGRSMPKSSRMFMRRSFRASRS